MELIVQNFQGIDTYTNPLAANDGQVIHSVNYDNFPYGGKQKRLGYSAFLGTADANGTAIKSLWTFYKNSGTEFYLYKAAGTLVKYSYQGTGAWTIPTNGTIGDGAHVGAAVSDDTMIIGDGTTSTRHTTDGISFTDNTYCPASEFFQDYQTRFYTIGTASGQSSLIYSVGGTAPTDFDPTHDSSVITIGGAGKVNKLFKSADRLFICKNLGAMQRWDGTYLVDMATELAPSSPYSVAKVEDYRIWLNRLGLFITNGDSPQLISNPIQRQIYNSNDTGIAGSIFDNAPATMHRYDYLLSAGTITDNFVGEQIPDAIIKYDYQKNMFGNYRFSNFPTAWHSFKDTNGVQQLIFGDATGQVYKVGGNSDNGKAIETNLILLLHGNLPHHAKEWQHLEVFASPGCNAKVQFAVDDVVLRTDRLWQGSGSKQWIELGDLSKGYTIFRFPPETRGRLMYLRFYEASTISQHEIYSLRYSFNPITL